MTHPDPHGSERRLDVAAVQLTSGDSLTENLATAVRLVEAAAERGAKLIVLPENFAFMGDERVRASHAERVGDREAPIQRALSTAARARGAYVVGGGMPERSADGARPYNTSVLFGPDGELVASYRKIHLFDVDLPDGTELRESDSTLDGSQPVVAPVAEFTVGLSICYDLRFPELYRALVDAGAEILLVPAAFTLHTGKDHWHVLLRARAIESQAYVVAAAQSGKHPLGRSTYGHALVADAWGTVVAEASDGLGYALASVDARRIAAVRAAVPCLSHRKL